MLNQAFELPKTPQNSALIMLSGGGDSVALLDIMVTKMGPSRVRALHVNYGLRADAQLEQLHCEQLCQKLGVFLHVHQAKLPQTGNLQANARAERYRVAGELLHDAPELDVIAVAHTADDQAETVLYRLASSPGRRALRGMAVRSGDIWRPLLGVRRQQLRDHLIARDLQWREDSSNVDPRFARSRVRRMLRDFEDLHPTAVANIGATAAQMRLEDDALAAVVQQQLGALRADDGSVAVAELAVLHPALAALVLRALVEEAAGGLVPLARERLTEVLATTAKGGTRQIDLGSGVTGELAYGRLRVYGRGERMTFGSDPRAMHSMALPLQGRISYLGWTLATSAESSESAGGSVAPSHGPAEPDAAVSFAIELSVTPAAATELQVRTRSAGDRMRVRGLGGSKSLQDIFVDRKVQRRLRDQYPVVCCGDEIIWIPGVAVADYSRLVLEDPQQANALDDAQTVHITATAPSRQGSPLVFVANAQQ